MNSEGDDIPGTGGIFWAESYRDIAQHRYNSYRVRNMAGSVLLVLEAVPEGIVKIIVTCAIIEAKWL